MKNFAVLRPAESVEVDPDHLDRLYRDRGQSGAEDMICRAMEEIALRLTQAERSLDIENRDEMRRQTRSLVAIAKQIGMGKLSHVAEDVVRCIDSGNEPALSATFARLVRVAEGYVSAIWDCQDQPI